MLKENAMKGVIIAAGTGTRLSHYHREPHKVLVPVAGRPVIDHTLEAFARAGLTDLVIVTGHNGDAIREWVGDGSRYGLCIRYVHNPDYRQGNALSLLAARRFTESDPFLLSMADHMVSHDLLERMLEIEGPVSALAVDYTLSAYQVEEGTRVQVGRDGLVARLGKGIAPWNGIDAGVFRLSPVIFEAIEELVEGGGRCELSRAVSRMIARGYPLLACDITGCFWQDIDTGEDLDLVRKALAG